MQAIKKHSIVAMAIIVFIFSNAKVSSFDDYNPDLGLQILHSLNQTADPCKDFYAYSCGNYNGYPDSDESVQEMTQYLDQKYETKLMRMFEIKHNAPEYRCDETNMGVRFREKAINYYESCVKENRRNLIKYFKQLNVIWPLLLTQGIYWPFNKTMSFSKTRFWQTLGILQGYNWNNLIITHDIIASKNGTLNIILEPGFNILPEDIAIESILKALKVDNASVIVQQLKHTQLKWLEIFQNYTTNEHTYTGFDLWSVTKEYPFLRIYIEHLLWERFIHVENIWIKNISFFNYLRNIERSSEEWSHQMNYLILHFLFYLLEDSSKEFSKKSCIKDLRNKFNIAVNYMYYEKMSLEEHKIHKDKLSHLNNQIKFIIGELFKENKLNLTRKQQKDLKDKLQNIKFNLGNLPYPVSSVAIDIFYHTVPNLDNGNYFKNHLLLLKHRFYKSLFYQEDRNFYTPSDNSLASSSSLFYVPKQNLVVIPFASLQYPLYHHSFKPQYQLSLMGFLMAHEMAHAFDSNGLKISNHYSILEQDLYNKSLECMQHQQPTEDIDERIADLFAERVAYQTFKKFYGDDITENSQRQFYTSMAQFFCNKGDLKFIDHDADAVRLHQIVRNSYGFAQAFSCPLDSPMNPQVKCRLY